jgi:hypothetical protein
MQQRITKQFLDTVQSNPNKDQFFYDPKLSGFGVKVTHAGRKILLSMHASKVVILNASRLVPTLSGRSQTLVMKLSPF